MSRLAFAAVRLACRAPRGGYFAARHAPRFAPGLRAYPIPTIYGPVICDLRESVCWPLVRHGCYPHWAEDEQLLPKLGLTKTSVVVDVGANLGATVRLFAALAGHVHAFEPSPRALGFLRANVRDLPNVTVHAVALGKTDGTALFQEEAELDQSHFAETGVTVPVRSLDGLGMTPDLIKIDVEGFEHLVLAGARETLWAGPTLLFEALDAGQLERSSAVIRAANAKYTIRHVGGESFNYLATV